MALGEKRRPKKIYEKVDTTDKKFISTQKQTDISSSYAQGEHIQDPAIFEIAKPCS